MAIKLNIFSDHQYIRKLALVFSLVMIPVWFLFGFDSGIGMIEEAVKALIVGSNPIQAAQVIYGKSFHFSSYVIYGLLFVGLSYHLESQGLKGSKNTFYSGFLVLLNMMVFEWWYMASFNHFQLQRSLIEWIASDFYFLLQYLGFLLLGVWSILALKVEGILKYFCFSGSLLITMLLLIGSVTLWVYFPLPVVHVTKGEWISSSLFPQTHYAYADNKLYVANDCVHLLNVTVKSLFAIVQLVILTSFRRGQTDA